MITANDKKPVNGFVAACTIMLLLWLIAAWHMHAHLAQRMLRDQQLTSLGFLPLAFDFQDRTQLMPKATEGAVVIEDAAGLRLQTTAPAFDVRLNLQGATFRPADIRRMRWDWRANAPDAVRWWLVVSAHDSDPGWIAQLPDFTPDIALQGLRFAKSGQPENRLAWEQLPAIQFMRLYSEAPVGMHVIPKQLAFVPMPGVTVKNLSISMLAPSITLHQLEHARARGQWVRLVLTPSPQSAPRLFDHAASALWLYPIALASLLGLVFWRVRTSVDTTAAMGLGLAILVAVAAAFLPQNLSLLPRWQQVYYGGLLLVAMLFAWAQRPTIAAPERTARPMLVASLAMAALILLAFGWPSDAPNMPRLISYVAFAFVQQWLLQRALLTPLQRAMPLRYAIALSACLFALWHAPNGTLMLLCFLGGLLWCHDFSQRGKLWPLVASHVLLGWLVVACVPDNCLRNTQIGSAFFMPGGSSR